MSVLLLGDMDIPASSVQRALAWGLVSSQQLKPDPKLETGYLQTMFVCISACRFLCPQPAPTVNAASCLQTSVAINTFSVWVFPQG